MRIHLHSDLHLEFGGFLPPQVDADVVVLAGDIHPGTYAMNWASNIWKDLPIIYVAGNHEFYGKRMLFKHYQKMQDAAIAHGINFLQNDTIVVNGVRFIGSTLWTDFNLDGDFINQIRSAALQLNDYNQICMDYDEKTNPYYTTTLKAKLVLDEHQKSIDYIVKQLDTPFDGKTVVITHHAPSRQSIHPMFANSRCNSLFASNLNSLIEYWEPDLWLHGHSHSSSDYMIGKTRVVANPRGYVGYGGGPQRAENNTWKPGFVIEI